MISISCQSSSGMSVDQLADQGVGLEQVVGQQQLGLVVDGLEQERHGLVQGVALGQQQVAVEFLVFGAVELEFDDLVLVEARQIDVLGVFDDFRDAPLTPALSPLGRGG